jgi:ELWxxDGT repeat protein
LVFFSGHDPVHGAQLWVTDGTPMGSMPVTDANDANGGLHPSGFQVFEDTVYFSGGQASDQTQLWKSDGTELGSGEAFVRSPSFGFYPREIIVAGGSMYLTAYDDPIGFEIFKSDGTDAGTVPRTMLTRADPHLLTSVDGNLFFSATPDGQLDYQLWVIDPSDTVTQLTSGGSSTGRSPSNLTPYGGGLLFAAFDPVTGAQLWRSDGTMPGTGEVTYIAGAANAGLNPVQLIPFRDAVYFAGDDGTGRQLWRTDGTQMGTVAVTSAAGGLGMMRSMAVAGNWLYFISTDTTLGDILWRSDGSSAGTAMVMAANGANGTGVFNYMNLLAQGGNLYFTAYRVDLGYQLWRSDGTAGGTVPLTNLATGGANVPSNFLVTDTAIYFTAPGAALWAWTP